MCIHVQKIGSSIDPTELHDFLTKRIYTKESITIDSLRWQHECGVEFASIFFYREFFPSNLLVSTFFFSIFPSYIIYKLALTVKYLQLRPLPASTAFPPAVIWPPDPTSPILIIIVIFIVPSGHAARPSPSPGRRRALPLDVRRVCWIVNSVFLQSSFEFLQSDKAVIEW